MKYDFKTKPYDHQLNIFELSKNRDFYALFMEMGTGKTKVTIDTFCHLFHLDRVKALLVLAPKGVYLNWKKEMAVHTWDNTPYVIAAYSASMKARERDHLATVMKAEDKTKAHVLLVNIESLHTKKGFDVAKMFLTNQETMLCIDESTAIKNHKSKRTKACLKLRDLAKYRRILTGTPITQSPLDLYSQCEFLEKGSTGTPSFFIFKHTFADCMQMNLGNRSFEKIVGFKNLDSLTNQIAPFSSRILKEECLDLPEKIYTTRHVHLTSDQQRLYETLKDESLLLLEQGILTSNNALTTLLKLQQILCGHLRMDDGTVIDIDCNKKDAIIDITQQISETSKVIIWCNFQRDIQILKELFKERAVTYYGLNSNEEREHAINAFENDPSVQFFIGTPQCGGKGLTLNKANYVIYYSNSFKLEDRLQSEDRCHRIGQDKNITYIDLLIPNTIDEKILKNLKDKQDLADKVLSDVNTFRELIL